MASSSVALTIEGEEFELPVVDAVAREMVAGSTTTQLTDYTGYLYLYRSADIVGCTGYMTTDEDVSAYSQLIKLPDGFGFNSDIYPLATARLNYFPVHEVDGTVHMLYNWYHSIYSYEAIDSGTTLYFCFTWLTGDDWPEE